MPVEIIRKVLEERAKKAAAEAARVSVIEKERSKREAREAQLAVQKENKRKLFVTQETKRILNESFILDGLKRIKNELRKRARIVDTPGGVSLVWDEVNRGHDYYEYSHLDIQIDPDNESVTISGENSSKLQKRQWKNKKMVETALAKAFLDPGRHEYVEDEPMDEGVHGQDSGR